MTMDIHDSMTILKVMATLPCREEYVLRMRFGFVGTEETLSTAAETLGISATRVKQLQDNALKKMRGWLK